MTLAELKTLFPALYIAFDPDLHRPGDCVCAFATRADFDAGIAAEDAEWRIVATIEGDKVWPTDLVDTWRKIEEKRKTRGDDEYAEMYSRARQGDREALNWLAR